ncbi:MAG: hypothetical protein M0C28_18680 [Candidatus Moduliflexus flocculans]|nr:hypothetical protein [Candidatus Moduliflexus flocculans]
MKDQGALAKSDAIENYYGIVEAVSGYAELISRGCRAGRTPRRQGAQGRSPRDRSRSDFVVEHLAQSVYSAKAVLWRPA